MEPYERKPRLPDPVALIAALLAMMTRFSCLGCPRLAHRIRRNLALLRHYHDDEIPPLLKQAAQQLERDWAQLHAAISDSPDSVSGIETTSDRIIEPASQSVH